MYRRRDKISAKVFNAQWTCTEHGYRLKCTVVTAFKANSRNFKWKFTQTNQQNQFKWNFILLLYSKNCNLLFFLFFMPLPLVFFLFNFYSTLEAIISKQTDGFWWKFSILYRKYNNRYRLYLQSETQRVPMLFSSYKVNIILMEKCWKAFHHTIFIYIVVSLAFHFD